jgi:hypothetical protein
MFAIINKSTAVRIPEDFSQIFRHDDPVLPTDGCTYYDVNGDEVKVEHIIELTNDTQINAILDGVVQINKPDIHDFIELILDSHVRQINPSVKKYIDQYINHTGVNVYAWYRLSQLTDYELHRHFKCNWPILPRHDPKWVARAVKLGVSVGKLIHMIGGEYPGAAAPVNGEVHDAGFIATELQKQLDKHLLDQHEKKHPPHDNEKRERQTNWLTENTTYGHYDIITPRAMARIMTYSQAENIVQMYYTTGSTDYALLAIWNLMASTETAHLAIKNPPVMRILNSIFRAHPQTRQVTAANALWYAFRTTYMEERMVGQKIIAKSRAWWSEEQFMALPVFNYMPDRSPYMPLIWGNMSLYQQLPYYVVGHRRFTTREEYIERCNYVTRYCGPKKGIPSIHSLIPHLGYSTPMSEGYGTIIYNSGGLHQSCMSVRPIEQNYTNIEKYMDSVYPDQHQCAGREMDEFYNAAQTLIIEMELKLPDNTWDADLILKELGDVMELKDDVVPPKLANLIELNKKMNIAIATSSDIDISTHTKTHGTYLEIVHATFQVLKDAGYERIWIKEIPRVWACKYAIMGPDLPRPIDMYRVDVSQVQLMRKFHLDCVRTLWDGQQRWALSSAICAHLTGVNTTMIWLSNNKDPITLQCTYAKRGFAKFTNKHMGDILRKAMSEEEPFSKYPIHYGPVMPNHGIFVDHLIQEGQKIEINNSKLEWTRKVGHKNHNGTNVVMPNTESFYGVIVNAL